MKNIALTLIASALVITALPAQADSLRLPAEFGRMEGPRDMNIFAIEPSILNERFYTSGKAERHQFVGKVLPYGAVIPDNDAPLCEEHEKKSAPAPNQSIDAPKTKEAGPPMVKPGSDTPVKPTEK